MIKSLSINKYCVLIPGSLLQLSVPQRDEEIILTDEGSSAQNVPQEIGKPENLTASQTNSSMLQIDSQIYRWIDGWIDRWIDRQID